MAPRCLALAQVVVDANSKDDDDDDGEEDFDALPP